MRIPTGAFGGVDTVCVSVTDRPAMVAVVDRACVPVWRAADSITVPFPAPAAPEVMLAHDAADVALQAHPAGAVTANASEPPADPIVDVLGDTV